MKKVLLPNQKVILRNTPWPGDLLIWIPNSESEPGLELLCGVMASEVRACCHHPAEASIQWFYTLFNPKWLLLDDTCF